MNLKEIQKIQNLGLDTEYLFTKGVSGLDISNPIEIDDILFRKMGRFIGYAPPEKLPFEICNSVESFDCYAYKENYSLIGVLLFELIFSNQSYIEIKLLNQNSEIRQLFIYLSQDNNLQPFLKIKQKETYKSFQYFSRKIDRYPFTNYLNDDLPTFNFSCSNYQDIHSKNRIEKADQLILSISLKGLINLAELFLNIGRIDNKQDEICLENPLYGNGGVSNTSIEARFWLPNSFGFYTEKIEDLQF